MLELHSLSFEDSHRPSGQVGLEITFYIECSYHWAPSLVWENLALGSENSSIVDLNQTDLYHVEFPGLSVSKLVLEMSKATGWDYYWDITCMYTVCQDPCTNWCKPLLLSPSQSDPQWPDPQIPLKSLWWNLKVVAPTQHPTVLREAVYPLQFISFFGGGRKQGQ